MVRCSIPERLGLIRVRSWRANDYDMLSRIPTFSSGVLNVCFDINNSRLTMYESLSEAPMLLELVMPNNDIVLRDLSLL